LILELNPYQPVAAHVLLDGIVANTAVRVADRRGREPLSELRRVGADAPPVLSPHDAIVSGRRHRRAQRGVRRAAVG
jgi:hypothetical protein